jgi:peptidyl-dipeptidase Dcp
MARAAWAAAPLARSRLAIFIPAFERALRAHREEVDTIAANAEAPSFANTMVAFDIGGSELRRIAKLFFNLAASETSAELQAVEREISPRLAAHYSAIYLDRRLFDRIDRLHGERTALGLAPEELRLLERVHLDFVREGARLSETAKARYAAIVERLAALSTQFSQNVLAEEASYRLVLSTERDLAGLPEGLRAAARSAAQERGLPDAWVITLSRSLIVPFLTYSDRRDLREQAFNAWIHRGENAGAHDNRPIAREILALRNEQARLHGHASYAEYALVDRMAGNPAAVAKLLGEVWEPAKARAKAERDALAAMALTHGETHAIEPWDWRYYAERCARRVTGSTKRREAVFFAGPDAGRSLRHRPAAVRLDLRREAGHPHVPSRRAHVRGARSRRSADRDLPQR